MRYAWFCLLLALAMVAFAQPEIGNPVAPVGLVAPVPQPPVQRATPPTSRESIIKVTPNGLFLLSRGILAKYDAKTLAPQGVLKLIDMPAQPARAAGWIAPDAAAMEANRQWSAARQAAMAIPVVLETPDDLLIVQGDRFFRVSQVLFAVEAKADLAEKPAAGVVYYNNSAVAPLVTLADTTLYVVRNTTVWSVDTATGEVLGKADLPKEMQQQPGAPMINPRLLPMPQPVPQPVLMDGQPVGGPVAIDVPMIRDLVQAFNLPVAIE